MVTSEACVERAIVILGDTTIDVSVQFTPLNCARTFNTIFYVCNFIYLIFHARLFCFLEGV